MTAAGFGADPLDLTLARLAELIDNRLGASLSALRLWARVHELAEHRGDRDLAHVAQLAIALHPDATSVPISRARARGPDD